MKKFNEQKDVLTYGGLEVYRKNVAVPAVQANEEFEITTTVNGEIETVMRGYEGDYIAVGVHGEIWRIDRAIFEKTYKLIRNVKLPACDGMRLQSAFYAFDGFFKFIEADFQYQLSSGEWTPVQKRLIFERGDAVALLVYNTDTQQIELAKQFRVPAVQDGGWIVELCAGMINDNEHPISAGVRELEEELGYRVKGHQLEYVQTFYVSPGGTSERIIVYYAEVSNADKASQGGGLVHEGEYILPEYIHRGDVQNQLTGGDIRDAKTIIALQWWLMNKIF